VSTLLTESPNPVETAPRRHPITVSDYLRMGEVGILGPDLRIELIEGEIVDMSPIGLAHSSRVSRLNRLLSLAVGDRALVWPQNPVILGDRSAPEPDLALLRWRDDYYAETQPGPDDILLIVEVSDTSLAYDRDTKLPLYARFQIPEVWILDIQGGHLEIHLEPDAGRYTLQFRPKDLSRVTIAALPDLELDLRDLL